MMCEEIKVNQSVTVVKGSHKGVVGTVKSINGKYIDVKSGNSLLTLTTDDVTNVNDKNPKTKYRFKSPHEYVDVCGADEKQKIKDMGFTVNEVLKEAKIAVGNAGRIFSNKPMTKARYEQIEEALKRLVSKRENINNDFFEELDGNDPIVLEAASADKKEELKEEEVMEENKVTDNMQELNKELKKQLGLGKWIEFMEIAVKDYEVVINAFNG